MNKSENQKEEKTKRPHNNVPADLIEKAVKCVIEGKLTVRKCAEIFNVNPQTLHDHIKKAKNNPEGEIKKLNHTPNQIFSLEQENGIAIYLKVCILLSIYKTCLIKQ